MTSKEKTLLHMKRVQDLLGMVAIKFIERGQKHDLSKLEPVEAEPLAKLDEIIEREGNVPFGSPEYEERGKILKGMLEHHYANNSHHVGYYENGINGMDLFDIVEMFVDWKAASERGGEESMNLEFAFDRYGVETQLGQIMKNTADRLGWK